MTARYVIAVFLLCTCLVEGHRKIPEGCKTDVLFVVDASTSVTMTEFDTMRNFIEKLTYQELKRLSPGSSQVGVVIFSKEVYHTIPFNKHHAHKEFVDALKSVNYPRGSTYLGHALEYVLKHTFTRENGMRTGVKRIVFILTDGAIEDEPLARKMIEEFNNKTIITLLVGIGAKVSQEGLKSIAHSDEDIISLKDWKSISLNIPPLSHCAADKTPKPVICAKSMKANVVFVVDSSTSIGKENFQKLKNFIVMVTGAFQVFGKEGVEVAVFQYSAGRNKTSVTFDLTKYTTRKGIEGGIRKMRWTMGDTKTGYAMMMVYRKLIRKARQDVKTVVIVLTDARSHDDVGPAAAALHEKGYTVLAVGVGRPGKVNEAELRKMASVPKDLHMFHAKNFDELPDFLLSITSSICRVNEEGKESKQQQKEKKQGLANKKL